MTISAESATIIAYLLLSIRLAPLFYLTPMDGMGQIPIKIRLFINLGLSLVLVNTLDTTIIQVPLTMIGLVNAALFELLIGTILAFGMHAAFGALMLAGQLTDLQSGYGSATVLNPNLQQQTPLMGLVLQLLGVVLFFALEGHHTLLRGFAVILDNVPLGSALTAVPMHDIVYQFGLTFVYGLILSAPVIGTLLLMDAGVAIMAKTMPQMNVYFLFLPLKIFIGLISLALALNYMQPVIEALFNSMFSLYLAFV